MFGKSIIRVELLQKTLTPIQVGVVDDTDCGSFYEVE